MSDRQKILIVDDNLQNIKVAANSLNAADLIIGFAKNGDEALERLQNNEFDLILLDVMMPGKDGYQVCAELKGNPDTANIPVLFLTARTDEESIEKAYGAGGADYVTKPFRARELIARVRSQLRQLQLIRKLEFLATRDSLTGIYNRRKFFELGETLLANTDGMLAALMIDVDYFKQVNDTYGHQAGDAVLKQLAARVTQMLPDSAVFGRLGGEEFAVLFPAEQERRAELLAESIRQNVAAERIKTEGSAEFACTVSIGVGTGDREDSLDTLLKIADDMLYRAKKNGKNRVILRNA